MENYPQNSEDMIGMTMTREPIEDPYMTVSLDFQQHLAYCTPDSACGMCKRREAVSCGHKGLHDITCDMCAAMRSDENEDNRRGDR